MTLSEETDEYKIEVTEEFDVFKIKDLEDE